MADPFDRMAFGEGVSRQEMADFFAAVGERSPAEIAGLLGYLHGRFAGGDAAAVVGALRDVAPQRPFHFDDGRTTVNMVGTGGGPSTFNITTTASFVVAAWGAVVVKSGSGAWRSKAGFADAATGLGVLKFPLKWDAIASIVDEIGMVFIPPAYHAPVLGRIASRLTPDVFRKVAPYINNLGPLLSPVRVDRRFFGARSPVCMKMLVDAARRLDEGPTTFVSASDGLDEVSTRATTTVVDVDDAGHATKVTVDPGRLGIDAPALDELRGYERGAAAECCERILDGQATEAQTQIVALNAAVVISRLDNALDVPGAYAAAMALIRDGEAAAKLHELREAVRHA